MFYRVHLLIFPAFLIFLSYTTAKTVAKADSAEINEVIEEVNIPVDRTANGCHCVNYSCLCCKHLQEKTIYLNATVQTLRNLTKNTTVRWQTENVAEEICIRLPCKNHNHVSSVDINFLIQQKCGLCITAKYLDNDYGFSVVLTFNNFTLFNETLSARNPPPLCIGAPYLEKYVDLCVRFYDLDVNRKRFHGCVDAEASLMRVHVANYDLGCYNIGHLQPLKDTEENIKSNFYSPSVVLI